MVRNAGAVFDLAELPPEGLFLFIVGILFCLGLLYLFTEKFPKWFPETYEKLKTLVWSSPPHPPPTAMNVASVRLQENNKKIQLPMNSTHP